MITKLMKTHHCLLLLAGLLNLLTFSSCDDNGEGLSADINTPITGYWQIAGTSIDNGADINGDGAVEGIVVHDDGTITEWQYVESAIEPFKIGYKTGTWTVSGNHYELRLSKGNGNFYTVTVAGNDNDKMYLAYQGKTSVIPFYRLQHLPGDGDSMMEMMAQMKFAGIQMSDVAGYWVLTDHDHPNGVGGGIYIDGQGNVSTVTKMFGVYNYNSVDYHSGTVSTKDGFLTFPYQSRDYYLYGIGKDILLATIDGQNVEKFVRNDIPSEVTRIEEIVSSRVPERLTGTWETTHVKKTISGRIVTDEDITTANTWAMQMYHKLVFGSNHVVLEYRSYDNNYYTPSYFMVDGQDLLTSASLDGLVSSEHDYVLARQIDFIFDTEMTLTTNNGGSLIEVYTYKKIQ